MNQKDNQTVYLLKRFANSVKKEPCYLLSQTVKDRFIAKIVLQKHEKEEERKINQRLCRRELYRRFRKKNEREKPLTLKG